MDADLPEVLFQFYAEVQPKKIDPSKPNTDTYANTTLRCVRAGINRQIKEKRGIDIINDVRFVKSNELFKGMQNIGKKKGKGAVKHKEIIEAEDMEHFKDYFSRYMQPSAIIRMVVFNVMFYTCRQARENFATITIETFKVK